MMNNLKSASWQQSGLHGLMLIISDAQQSFSPQGLQTSLGELQEPVFGS